MCVVGLFSPLLLTQSQAGASRTWAATRFSALFAHEAAEPQKTANGGNRPNAISLVYS